MKPITKKQFDYFLYQYKQEGYIMGWEEISQQDTYEYVYSFKTRNKSLRLLVYTSIDMSINKTRSYSTDRIRFVYQWDTRNGLLYAKVKHLNRTDNILDRLPKALHEAIFITTKSLRDYNWQMQAFVE